MPNAIPAASPATQRLPSAEQHAMARTYEIARQMGVSLPAPRS